MDYIAIVALQLNGNSYASGDVLAPEDVPTTKLRSMVDKGLIEAVGGASAPADVQTYAPVITRSITNPTLGTGNVVSGRYVQNGNVVTVWINMWLGVAGFVAGSGTVYISLPVTALTNPALASAAHGTGYVYNGNVTYNCIVAGIDNSVGGNKAIVWTQTGLGTPLLSSAGAFQLTLTYEAA